MINGIEHQLPASMKTMGRYEPILDTSIGQFDAMLSHHCKVMVVRLDLHMICFTKDNIVMSQFMQKLKKKLKNKFNQSRVGYIWCREHAEAKAQHYHLALMLDGNKNQKPHSIIKLAEEIWVGWDHPKPYTPKNCYYIVKRGDQAAYLDALDRMSYLAKVATKGNRPPSTNDYGSSRIKPKQA